MLMAVYGGDKAEFLQQAVDSVLCQTVAPEEILVVCDGPLPSRLDEELFELQAKAPEQIRILRLPENRGLGAALNAGLHQCRNDLVARMDADDLALPDRMERQLAGMAQYPETAVLGGQIAEFREDPNRPFSYRTVPADPERILHLLRRRNPMNHVTVLYRRDWVLEAGGYPEFAGPGFEDYYLWVKLLAWGAVLRNIPEVCCNVRVNEAQYSRRGGWAYFCNAMKVQHLLTEEGLIGPGRFCFNMAAWFASAVLLTAGMRKALCLRLLRKKVPPEKSSGPGLNPRGECCYEAAHYQP